MLISHHGSHSYEVPADVAIAGGICANHDGSVVMTLHRSGSIVAWSECSHLMLSDETTRFRPILSKDCPSASTFVFISPKVVALACSDASITLWHIVDGKRGMSWKAHSSGVSVFLLTQGSPDGLELPGLFSFSRSGVGQVRLIRVQHQNAKQFKNPSQIFHQLWNLNNGTVLLAWQAAEVPIVAAGFLSPGVIAVVGADAIIRSTRRSLFFIVIIYICI